MPIFLERFILPVFAAALVLLAISNPMNFDPTQRITGTIALVCLAYFAAHTVYKDTHPPPVPSFVGINILSVVSQDEKSSVFWGTYDVITRENGGLNKESFLTPLDYVFWLQIVVGSAQVNLSYIGVEVQINGRWSQLDRVPLDGGVALFAGDLNESRPIKLEGPEIYSFLHSDIESRKVLTCFAAFNYQDPNSRSLKDMTFRFTLKNALGQQVQVVAAGPTPIADPMGSGGWTIRILDKAVDLTKLQVRRYPY